jgi:hypothetical protein
MNTFKVGSRVTVNAPVDFASAMCTRDVTQGKEYILTEVDTDEAKDDVVFYDDTNERVLLRKEHVTLVEG